jgi:hypothetical protein
MAGESQSRSLPDRIGAGATEGCGSRRHPATFSPESGSFALPCPPAFRYHSAHERRATKAFLPVCLLSNHSSNRFYLRGDMAALHAIR